MSISLRIMSINRDRVRQVLNLVLAFAQPLTTFLAFNTGTSFDEATRGRAATPPVTPAPYAFIIWSLIYAGSLAYSAYQARADQRANDMLRRIGFPTASAFAGTVAWLVAARFGRLWLTVVCIFWILASLIAAFAEIIRRRAPHTAAERYFVVMPVSVFIGWVTVATIANTASALAEAGFRDVGLTDQNWAILMLIVAAVIGSAVTIISRGNAWYALTIVWALAAIVVADRERHPGPALAAAGAGCAVIGALIYARLTKAPDPEFGSGRQAHGTGRLTSLL